MSETARKVIELVNGQWGPSDYQRAEAGRELARRVERVLAECDSVRADAMRWGNGLELASKIKRLLDGAE